MPAFLIPHGGLPDGLNYLARRIRSSAVTNGTPSTMAVAAISRSAGSFEKPAGNRTASAAISGVIGLTMTGATVSRTKDSTLPRYLNAAIPRQPSQLPRVIVVTANPRLLPCAPDGIVGFFGQLLWFARHPDQDVGVSVSAPAEADQAY